MNNRGCLGRKMYSDSTLKSFTKEELIDLLYVAEKNYQALSETYEQSVSNSMRILGYYDEVIEEVASLLDDATGYGDVICPLEYLGRCACITTDNGFECPDDTNANWAYAIKEKIKEKIETDEVNHEQVQGSIEQY